MTQDRLPYRASQRPSKIDRRQGTVCLTSNSALIIALAVTLFASYPITTLAAQPLQEAPVIPSGALGSVRSSSTISLLGVAALPEAGSAVDNRNVLWFAATQPVARVAAVRFDVIGSGFYRPTSTVGARDAAEGTVALRALARLGPVRSWTAVSYGRSSAEGHVGNSGDAIVPVNFLFESRSDSTVMRREDVGKLARAEAGVLTTSGPVEFAFGVSYERVTRVTTERVTHVSEPVVNPSSFATEYSQASERRDLATGIASASFRTGATDWLVSVTTPIASWDDGSSNAPRPLRTPTVASVAFMQPLTAWLSVVGAASTNASTVGSYALRDERADGRRREFAPVVALGVRLSGFSARNRTGEPRGVLAFETRTIGIIDAVTAETIANDSLTIADTETGRELVRVLLVVDAPRAESVELMGDATSWSVTSMSRTRDGKWRAELRVQPGMHRVVVRADGGHWVAPPGLPLSTDDFGSHVGMLIVKLRGN